MASNNRTSTDVLKGILDIPGIEAAIVVGRDGFVIEAEGQSEDVEEDVLGACLATAINGIEVMGQEMSISTFQDMFVEYGSALIMCRPIGDAVVALVAQDASKLGIIRHKIKEPVRELTRFF